MLLLPDKTKGGKMSLNDILKRVNQGAAGDVDDGNRTKEFQDFFTPSVIAEDLFTEYKKYLKPSPYVNKILEPAVGSGNLIWPLLKSDFLVDITCMDIQEEYLKHLKEEAEKRGYKIKIRDDGLLSISN